MKKRKHGILFRLKTLHSKGEIYNFDSVDYFRIDGQVVNRVRVFGTVISRYDKSDPDPFVSITIDDGSDTMRLKLWSREFTRPDGSIYNAYLMSEGILVGDNLDVIGKVRKWEDEFYIIPTKIGAINDIEWEMKRRVLLINKDVDEKGGLLSEENIDNNVKLDTTPKNLLSIVEDAFVDDLSKNTVALITKRSGLQLSEVEKTLKELGEAGIVLTSGDGTFEITI